MAFGPGFRASPPIVGHRALQHLDLPAIRMVGYRQVWQYFAGQITYNQMLEQIPIATRQLAKRQLTWLRSWPEAEWFDSENPRLLLAVVFARITKLLPNGC